MFVKAVLFLICPWKIRFVLGKDNNLHSGFVEEKLQNVRPKAMLCTIIDVFVSYEMIHHDHYRKMDNLWTVVKEFLMSKSVTRIADFLPKSKTR